MKNLGNVTKESDGYKVVFHRTLNHTIDKVWDAITNPEQLKYWFTDIEMDFKPGGRMVIRFRDEARSESHGEIVSIEPPHKFAWSWEGELAVWELKKVSVNETELTLTYSKLGTDYAVSAPAGFHWMLDTLEERLSGSDAIYPFGTMEKDPEQTRLKVHYAAHVFNTLPDVIKHKPVVVEKSYDAPLRRVWEAITRKEQMKQWYFDVDDFRAEEGFSFKFAGQGRKGEQYIHVCTVTEVVPEKKLQYSWSYEGYHGYSLVTLELSEEGGKTRLRLTHHGLETFPQDSGDFAWSSFNEGWNHIVGIGLVEFLKKS